MTTHQNNQPTPPPADNGAFLPLRTAVVLLTALVLGLIVGGLTALTGTHPATAVIAGLTTAGAGTAALRTLIQ
ncbi:hypothetical protein [Streptomyces sp. Isolate_45]|uniref:hypothetical protein n=1 Tax=Streptomyces sp. Isolate_45 TaxID=2950111 RepID=UPI002481B22D|nr:hypothetical protein [Streptomyces sp. Isolate_45]MDA5283696.1 hypothetical protein [Streptomyces sp. Isolate_45]